MPIIEFSVIYSILSIILIITATLNKEGRNLILLMAFPCIIGSVLCITTNIYELYELQSIAVMFPFGLFFIVISAISIYIYSTCTELVSAELVDFEEQYHGRGFHKTYNRTPIFKYTYNGKTYQSKSRAACTEKQWHKLFPRSSYTICINPKRPDICIDKNIPIIRKSIILSIIGIAIIVIGLIA